MADFRTAGCRRAVLGRPQMRKTIFHQKKVSGRGFNSHRPFGNTLFWELKEGLPEGGVKRNLTFNSDGVLLVSGRFAKRTDTGKDGGFSLDVLHVAN